MVAVLPPLILHSSWSSKKLNEIINQIPDHWLIGFQSFRILMELILLMLFLKKLFPNR